MEHLAPAVQGNIERWNVFLWSLKEESRTEEVHGDTLKLVKAFQPGTFDAVDHRSALRIGRYKAE